jgi:anti-sigma B factor antagonist
MNGSNNSSPTLKVALCNDLVCVKICGRANFTSSLDLKKLVNELAQRGCAHFLLDLSECANMDSTFLGVLAGIGLKFAESNGSPCCRAVELLNPSPRIAELLENLGVSHLFKISNPSALPAANFEPVPEKKEAATRAEVTTTCLEAHQMLMRINPANVSKFKDVAEFLAEDLKKIKDCESPGQPPAH